MQLSWWGRTYVSVSTSRKELVNLIKHIIATKLVLTRYILSSLNLVQSLYCTTKAIHYAGYNICIHKHMHTQMSCPVSIDSRSIWSMLTGKQLQPEMLEIEPVSFCMQDSTTESHLRCYGTSTVCQSHILKSMKCTVYKMTTQLGIKECNLST